MPCTLKGYPEKWKEFETLKREKAIEIANAMLREGYLEKDVIPIATKKAKDWYRTLSKEEIKALEEENIVQFHTATMEKQRWIVKMQQLIMKNVFKKYQIKISQNLILNQMKVKVVAFAKESQLLMVHMQKLWDHLKTYNISIN
ncbi:hypothetical protein CR496_02393 [Staphylococcus aureus]|nr:hypothetical protein CR496_02393 [Staphylococcus aureus]